MAQKKSGRLSASSGGADRATSIADMVRDSVGMGEGWVRDLALPPIASQIGRFGARDCTLQIVLRDRPRGICHREISLFRGAPGQARGSWAPRQWTGGQPCG